MYQRFNYLKIYKLKNLHLYTHKVNRFEILKDFDCDVCDVIKIIKIINKKFYIKITILTIKIISTFKASFL